MSMIFLCSGMIFTLFLGRKSDNFSSFLLWDRKLSVEQLSSNYKKVQHCQADTELFVEQTMYLKFKILM